MSDTKLTPAGLSALMCARICHDLVSPVGALGTALEVLGDDANADMHEDAMNLVKSSARQASAKLQYLRLAFGAGGSAPGMIGVAELIKLADGVYGEGKVTLVWDAKVSVVEKTAARLLLNLIMLGVNSIPFGGELHITPEESDDTVTLTLKATGNKARLADFVPITFAGKAPDIGFDGRTIQPFYAGMIVREAKGQIDARFDNDVVTLSATLPKVVAV
ncbi:histidine phosphotransferase family protein [Fretibacter rubidus]|uniref:histidine phosphotransferase family protein n=1 Tax=Fretibacter rubidus TaxID=570162 RepID=UPI00352AD27A